MRKILITNDDGYQSRGIASLVKIMKNYGEVTVVAPKKHQSGMSMAVSLGYKPIAVKNLGVIDGVSWHYVDGTPATAAKYAVDVLFADEKPDLVVSGINHGSNASTAMWYSGTIGAAREAALAGVPAIGVSLDNMHSDADFTVVEELLPGILDRLLEIFPISGKILYNINFPDVPASEIKGVKACTQGVEWWINEFVPPTAVGEVIKGEPVEDGEELFLMAGDVVPAPDNDPDTDNWANDHNYIAITPHMLDNTDYAEVERLKKLGF